MITALQNFISRRGKFIFIPLLLVIVVAFVLYLSQGASVFDFLPDSQRQTEEFYGHDLKDPTQFRQLSAENQLAADFGSVIGPVGGAMQDADENFLQYMQSELQSMFSSTSPDSDRSRMQFLFQAIQSWPYQPNRLKVRRISQSGLYGPDFSQASLKAKLAMNAQGESWGFLPLANNIPTANKYFTQWLASIDPALGLEDNRTTIFEEVGRRRGFNARGVESVLYSYFRSALIEDVYTIGGFVLDGEAEIDLRINDFAWDAEALSITLEDLNESIIPLATLSLQSLPKEGDSFSVSYGAQQKTFVFSARAEDDNSSNVTVQLIGDVVAQSVTLAAVIEKADLGFSARVAGAGVLSLSPDPTRLPNAFPTFVSSSAGLVVSGQLDEDFRAFHEERKNDEDFAEPARTFATVLTLRNKDYLSLPPAPDEAYMRSYFENNKASFDLAPPPPPPPPPGVDANSSAGEKGPVGKSEDNASPLLDLNLLSLSEETNASVAPKELAFEDVREEVRQRILEGYRIDAERRAEEKTRKAGTDLLVKLNDLRDELKRKYSTYVEVRKSAELSDLISQSGVVVSTLDFSDKEMSMKGASLRLERREGELRKNQEPLMEVASLNQSVFFTQSIRKSRDGYVIFLLDRKTEKGAGSFADASFSLLYEKFSEQRKLDSFVELVDQTFETLGSDPNALLPAVGHQVSMNKKSSRLLEAYYQGINRRVGARLTKMEKERDLISSAERDSNATPDQLSRKTVIDLEIEKIRTEQAETDKDSSLGSRLAQACSNLEPDGKWTELERTSDTAIFVRLKKAYFLKQKMLEPEEVNTRTEELQFSRAEKGRDFLLRDLITREGRKSE